MSTDRQRDAEMDRLLRTALQTAAGATHSTCPEAGLLAAYIEQALAADEKERLDHHLAECSRCQQTLAVMTRDLPAQDARPLIRTTWLSGSRWHWLVPAALAASLTVYIATRQAMAPGVPPPPLSTTQVVPEDLPPPPPFPSEPSAPSAVRQSSSGTLTQLQPAELGPERRAKTAPSPARSAEADQASVPREVARADVKAPANIAQAAAPLAEKRAEIVPTINEPVAQPAAPTRMAAAPPMAAGPPLAAGTPMAVPLAAPRVARDERVGEPRQESLRRNAAFAIGAPTIVAAPGGNVLWRLETGGRISRSQDDGATWYPKRSGVNTELLAGSAPSAAVCWIVGMGGTVLLTTDGERWDLRPFPARVDLTGVEARSARVATVTARDGRRFNTVDGGATWTVAR